MALNFWTASKPVETKLVILRWLLELSCIVAIIAALYFGMTTDRATLPFVCAFYNLLVQGALFAISPLDLARREILSLVFAAVFFATIPTYSLTGALAKAQFQLAGVQSRMLDVQEKASKIEADVVESLKMLVDVLPTPSPSPTSLSPPPAPNQTPK